MHTIPTYHTEKVITEEHIIYEFEVLANGKLRYYSGLFSTPRTIMSYPIARLIEFFNKTSSTLREYFVRTTRLSNNIVLPVNNQRPTVLDTRQPYIFIIWLEIFWFFLIVRCDLKACGTWCNILGYLQSNIIYSMANNKPHTWQIIV